MLSSSLPFYGKADSSRNPNDAAKAHPIHHLLVKGIRLMTNPCRTRVVRATIVGRKGCPQFG